MTLALIGGQYGSEGKGVIAAGLAPLFGAAVRTGGPNAGHSFYFQDTLYKMRQVPCAWVSDSTMLFLGAGAVIDPVLLASEVDLVGRLVIVDPQATIITEHHHNVEHDEGLREAIGSTTEGVGAARISKIKRNGATVLAKDYKWPDTGRGSILVEPTVPYLSDIWRSGGRIMLEGTQGALLSLHHGRYPFVTSNETNAAALAADAGIPPSVVEHAHLVVRTFPIRVAGNSGPTGGGELDWSYFIESGLVSRPEQTTVTKLQRRIFSFAPQDLDKAIDLNDPCGIWLTFGDYLSPQATDARDIDDLMGIEEIRSFVSRYITGRGLRLLGVGVGGDRWTVIETGDACHRERRHTPTRWPLVQNGVPSEMIPF